MHGELRRSLENANKALRRYLKEAEAVGGSGLGMVELALLLAATGRCLYGGPLLASVGLAGGMLLEAEESMFRRMRWQPQLLRL